MSVTAVILAAGASTRFGSHKQLLAMSDGRPMLVHAIDTAAAVAEEVVVVLGANAEMIEPVLPAWVRVVHNPRWSDGPGTSVGVGIATVRHEAALLMLCDQPRVTADDLRTLIDAGAESGASSAAYDGIIGVPACVHRRHFPALMQLAPDAGARQFLRDLGALTSVPIPAAAHDIDHPAAAEALFRNG